MTTAVLLPIKEPARVKTRLAGLLSLTERQQLVWAMFEDVCSALAAAKRANAVFLVSSYAKAVDRARDFGFDAIRESAQVSESASVDAASRLLAERGFAAVLRLPADIPLVQATDVDALLEIELHAPAALLVPSFEGTGTNAILRAPPALFPSRFGPNSLALHGEEAARVGVQPLIHESPRLALDIDEPGDILRLLETSSPTATRRFLDSLNIADRITGMKEGKR